MTAQNLLGQRLAELQDVIRRLAAAERDALRARHDANVAEWAAYLSGEGAVETRKIQAKASTADLSFAADNAEAEVRHLAREMKLAQARVDVGRTFSADLRAEAMVAGRDGTP